MSMKAVFEQKRAIEERISALKAGLCHLPDMRRLGIEAGEWRTRLESMIHMAGGSTSNFSEQRKTEHLNAKAKYDGMMATLKEAKEKENALRLEIDDLTEQLASFDQEITLKELLGLQGECVALEQQLDNLEKAISLEKQTTDADEHENNHQLAVLSEERENLLADIASGVRIESGKLESIEQQIAREEELHEKRVDSIIKASQTIAGLSRKKEQLEKELFIARKNYHDGLVDYLDQEIEKAGKEYTTAAGQLSEIFMRITAVSSLRNKFGSQLNIFGPYTANIQIPSFALDVCRSGECRDMPGMLFRFFNANQQDALNTELKRLSKIGIKVK